MLTRMPYLPGCLLGCPCPLGCPCLHAFWDAHHHDDAPAHWDAPEMPMLARMPPGMPMPPRTPVDSTAMVPSLPRGTQHTARSSSFLAHCCHPTPPHGTRFFCIPARPLLAFCELQRQQSWAEGCMAVGTVAMAERRGCRDGHPSLPASPVLPGAGQPFVDSAVLFCITALKSPWRDQ